MTLLNDEADKFMVFFVEILYSGRSNLYMKFETAVLVKLKNTWRVSDSAKLCIE